MRNFKYKVKVPVDTGSIVVALFPKMPEETPFISVAKGKYQITLKIKDSWNGPNKQVQYLEAKRDAFLLVADALYKNEAKEIFYEPKNLYKKGCSISTGGDGEFEVEIILTPVKTIPEDPYKVLLKEANSFFKTRKYNEKTAQSFVKKFLQGSYCEEIEAILGKARSQHMEALLKNIDKLLKKK